MLTTVGLGTGFVGAGRVQPAPQTSKRSRKAMAKPKPAAKPRKVPAVKKVAKRKLPARMESIAARPTTLQQVRVVTPPTLAVVNRQYTVPVAAVRRGR